jgi:hypothetical protein
MTNHGLLRVTGALVVVVLALTGCGSGGGDNKEGDGAGGGTVACDGTAITADTLQLPALFPTPDGVTFTESRKDGPSGVAEGYFEGELKDAYDGWKRAFTDAGYTILFDELEEHDSEVSYKTADGTSTGQVALRDECKESGRISVHITDRPA